ncbi:hypothetical protein [Aeromicrobium sp.]|uniref:hypothetical protein n=1 Tax=Aeromicrobium sp. TaxID=1871063 RepID=UPI002FC80C61
MRIAGFHGALVASPWTRGSFWDRVDVTVERIHLRAWLRKNIVIDREQITAIEFEKVRGPFIWATNVRFLLSDGTTAPKLFVPFRTRSFRRALETLDWPTQDRD